MYNNALSIGWTQESITPEQPVNLFGMFNERISTHVEEPCTVTALALESTDSEHVIWLSCDLLNITLDVVQDVRNAVSKQIPEFNSNKVLISCIHTHNAPNFQGDLFPEPPTDVMTPDGYRAFFIERATEVAVRAWTARTVGQVSPALGHAVLGWCRRVVYSDGTGQMYGKHTKSAIPLGGTSTSLVCFGAKSLQSSHYDPLFDVCPLLFSVLQSIGSRSPCHWAE